MKLTHAHAEAIVEAAFGNLARTDARRFYGIRNAIMATVGDAAPDDEEFVILEDEIDAKAALSSMRGASFPDYEWTAWVRAADDAMWDKALADFKAKTTPWGLSESVMHPDSVSDALGKLLEPHEDAWKADIHDGYKAAAETQHKKFNAYWSQVRPGQKIDRYNPASKPPGAGFIRYPANPPGAHLLHSAYGSAIHAARNGTATIDHDAVKRAADAAYQEMRSQFIARGTEKITHMAGTAGVTRVEGAIRHNRALEGAITAHFDNGHHATVDAAVQTNYRYGDNAADGHLTVYAQYPFRVTHAHLHGVDKTNVDADDVAVANGGRPLAQAVADKKNINRAAKAEWSKKRDELERKTDSWREVHDVVTRHAKESELAAIAADPAHPKHAKLQKEYAKNREALFGMNPHLRDNPEFAPKPLTTVYPAPPALDTWSDHVAKHKARLGLTAWPTPEEAKAQLAAHRDALAKHKAAKPVAESAQPLGDEPAPGSPTVSRTMMTTGEPTGTGVTGATTAAKIVARMRQQQIGTGADLRTVAKQLGKPSDNAPDPINNTPAGPGALQYPDGLR